MSDEGQVAWDGEAAYWAARGLRPARWEDWPPENRKRLASIERAVRADERRELSPVMKAALALSNAAFVHQQSIAGGPLHGPMQQLMDALARVKEAPDAD